MSTDRGKLYASLPSIAGACVALSFCVAGNFIGFTSPITWLLVLAAAGIFVFLFMMFVLSNVMPRNLQVVDTDEGQATQEMLDHLHEFEKLGFRVAGPLLRIEAKPGVLLLPSVHETQPVYGAIYKLMTVPPKTTFEVVSIFEPMGGLTTSPTIESGAVPPPPRVFYQLFPGADVATLLEKHLEGLKFLREHGLTPRRISDDTYVDDVRQAMLEMRTHVFRRPIRNTAIAIWRAGMKRSPHVGPVSEQAKAAKALLAIQRGEGTLTR